MQLGQKTMQSLDFTFNWFFMKLFKTSTMEIVNCCQSLLGCDLPSTLLKQCFEKFITSLWHVFLLHLVKFISWRGMHIDVISSLWELRAEKTAHTGLTSEVLQGSWWLYRRRATTLQWQCVSPTLRRPQLQSTNVFYDAGGRPGQPSAPLHSAPLIQLAASTITHLLYDDHVTTL